MKKLTAFLLAAAILSLSSCSTEKPVNSDTDPVGEVTETEKLPVYGELNPEDFKEIDVNLNFLDDDAPVKMTTYDLSDIRFAPKKSPCTAEDVREKYIVARDLGGISFENYDALTEEEKEAILNERAENSKERMRALCDNEFEGRVDSNCTLVGDDLYFIVDFDRLCSYSYSHCFDIMSINIKTKELKTLYSYSDLSNGYNFYNMAYGCGKLWLYMSVHDENFVEENGYHRNPCMYSLDLESGAFERAELPEKLDETKDAWFTSEYNLLLTVRDFDDNYSTADYRFYEYDEETGGWNEIEVADSKGDSFIRYNGAELVASNKNEDKTSYAECSRYRLNTGLKSATMYAATQKRITFLQSDTTVNILYVYDLEKMERYKLDLTSKISNSGIIDLGEELVIYDVNGNSPIYLMPEYGIAYRFKTGKPKNLRRDYGKVYSTLVDWSEKDIQHDKIEHEGYTEYIMVEPERTPLVEVCVFE